MYDRVVTCVLKIVLLSSTIYNVNELLQSTRIVVIFFTYGPPTTIGEYHQERIMIPHAFAAK